MSKVCKPGAAPGRSILAIDLSTIADQDDSLSAIKRLGYSPELRSVEYADGVHSIAVLRDESTEMGDRLMSEWRSLLDYFPSESVHLWNGK